MDIGDYRSFWGPHNLRRWTKDAAINAALPEDAMRFLTEVGLPSNNFYFQFGAEYDALPPAPGQRQLRAFGRNTFPERPFCVDSEGSVFMLCDGERVFCNSSIERFAASVTERERCRRLALVPIAKGGYLGRLTQLADFYETQLKCVDPSAFVSPLALWPGSVQDMRDEADQ